MSIPGFTAEASIGPMTQVYRVHDPYGTFMTSGLYPQLNGGDTDLGWKDDVGDEAVTDVADQIDEADSDTGLGHEAVMTVTDHVTVADDDEVHVEA